MKNEDKNKIFIIKQSYKLVKKLKTTKYFKKFFYYKFFYNNLKFSKFIYKLYN